MEVEGSSTSSVEYKISTYASEEGTEISATPTLK
jgi:hypothetical protein